MWNQVLASTLMLMVTLNWVASIAFLLIDYDRFAPCVVVFFVLGVGGLSGAGAVARRRGVRVIAVVPSRREIAIGTFLFGVLFFLVTRAASDGETWQQLAVLSAVIALAWGVMMRIVLQHQRQRALRAHEGPPDGPRS